MGHDQRFKKFLHAFLPEFMKLFYPHVEKRLELGEFEFLDTEVFTELHDGSRREADVVAKLTSRDGEPELVLIHIEVQARMEADVPERMFEYYSLLRARYRLPIFPIAVYLSRGKEGFATEVYREKLFGTDILKFQYESVRLAHLDAEEYVDKGGPVGAALAALMNRSARSPSRSLESLRVSMMWKVVESALDETSQGLLIDLIQTYFPLSEKQQERYDRLVARKENRKVQEVELTWAEKLEQKGLEKGLEEGREKGREEGREEGLLTGKRETLLRLFSAKFGAVSKATTARVEAIDSVDELDALLERVLTATSPEDMKL